MTKTSPKRLPPPQGGGSSDDSNTDNNSSDDGSSDDDGSDGDSSDDDDTDTSTETVIVTFADNQSSNTTLVNVTAGSTSTSKGTATYNGTTYSTCLKMESSTSVTITTTQVYNVTLVFGDNETASFTLDGVKYSADSGSTYTFSSLAAGTYTLTKNASVNLYAIVFEPVTE